METNVALEGRTFKLTRNNFFYFGWRKVLVSEEEKLERIRAAIEADSVFDLRDLFEEVGGFRR
jgi:hypothetical protein